MNYPLVVAASLGSTGFFAASTVLKHRSAATLTTTPGTLAVRLGRFVASTVSHRWWLAGLAADAGALPFRPLPCTSVQCRWSSRSWSPLC